MALYSVVYPKIENHAQYLIKYDERCFIVNELINGLKDGVDDLTKK